MTGSRFTRVAGCVAGATLLLAGCDADTRPTAAYPSVDQGRVELPSGKGVYRAGANLRPGVYASTLRGFCDAVVTRTRTFRYDDENPPGVLLREAVTVWNVRRIVVREGEFLHTYACPSGWQLQDPDHPVVPDPATLEGGCEILFGREPVADQVVRIRKNPFPDGPREQRLLPEKLDALGAAGNEALGPDASMLSTLVYRPAKARDDDSVLLPRYANALDRLRRTCGK